MNDGGPAFDERFGMTLRDYFAAKAMQAIVSNTDYGLQFVGPPERWPNAVAGEAYKHADAMLNEREKKS